MADQDHLDRWVSAVLLAYKEAQETMGHEDLEVHGVPGAYLVRRVSPDRKDLVEYVARKVR